MTISGLSAWITLKYFHQNEADRKLQHVEQEIKEDRESIKDLTR